MRLSELSGLPGREARIEVAVPDAYIGFYWTLPVPWASFRDLSRDVEAAARASRTVRYQRARIRQYVGETAHKLIHEVVYITHQPDRATPEILNAVKRAADVDRGATLLLVNFSDPTRWRPISKLPYFAEKNGIRWEGLPATPITVGGEWIDPIAHFKTWRQRDKAAMARFRINAHAGLRAALATEPARPGRWGRIAERLNCDAVKTLTGGTWTADGVRKLSQRAHADLV